MLHAQLPTFFNRHVFLKVAPGANTVPSGTVTSAMNCALSHEEGGTVTVTGPGVFVGVAVGGVPVTVGGGGAPLRTITGLPQMARSPTGEPDADINRINLTSFPASASSLISG